MPVRSLYRWNHNWLLGWQNWFLVLLETYEQWDLRLISQRQPQAIFQRQSLATFDPNSPSTIAIGRSCHLRATGVFFGYSIPLCFLSSWYLTAGSERFIFIFFQGIARRLVKAALCEAAKKREMRYSDLKKIDRGVRRHFHDDITVTVLFLDTHRITRSLSHSIMTRSLSRGSPVSIKGGGTSSILNLA